MKTLNLITTALLLSAAAVTSCNKSQYSAVPDSGTAAATGSINNGNSLSDLSGGSSSTSTTMDSRLRISSGYINTAYIGIYGNEQLLYESKDAKRVDLFKSLMNNGINIPAAYYANLTLKMSANAGNTTPAMYLKGTVKLDDDIFVPVEIVISSATNIIAHPKDETIQQGTMPSGLMNLATDQVGMHITQAMWEGARSNSGIITISATQHTDLYRIIMANMNTMMHIDASGAGSSMDASS